MSTRPQDDNTQKLWAAIRLQMEEYASLGHITALKDLVRFAHNPNYTIPAESLVVLQESGLVRPDGSSFPEAVKAALHIQHAQVWLGNPAAHLGTTEELSIRPRFDNPSASWVTDDNVSKARGGERGGR